MSPHTTSIRIALVLAVTAALAWGPLPRAAAEEPDHVERHPVTVDRGDGTTTPGVVFAPPGARSVPGVVLVHGSGTGREDAEQRERYAGFATAFARAGVSALLYDKRTDDYTPAHRDFSRLADDALAGVRALRTSGLADPRRVGLWGLSEGGWVAPLAASRAPDTAFLITVAANIESPARQQDWANRTRLHLAGVRGSLADRFAPTALRQIVGAGVFANAGHDSEPALARLRMPVLAVWGQKDRLTPPGESLTGFRNLFDRIGKRDYTLRVIPNADHGAHVTEDGYDRRPELAPEYERIVADWVHGLPGSAAAPFADPPPAQALSSAPVAPLARWEGGAAQAAGLAVLGVGLGGFALTAARRRWRLPRSAALTATAMAGSTAVAGGLLVHLMSPQADLGPLVLGRPLAWLAAQGMAAAAVAGGAWTAVATARAGGAAPGATARLGLLGLATAAFVPLALYWGVLLP
ncbi:S9 family peptidase [Tsukamurella sp. 1534]|uniref:alpha/beta hydrolase family protein n=1 Tax=Tsukamurella sp. 1534 TaxID=1151061 RepID=UPI0003051FA0|nr:alpha/beta fold hydrolase [Tsukamurella sp. 1534]